MQQTIQGAAFDGPFSLRTLPVRRLAQAGSPSSSRSTAIVESAAITSPASEANRMLTRSDSRASSIVAPLPTIPSMSANLDQIRPSLASSNMEVRHFKLLS